MLVAIARCRVGVRIESRKALQIAMCLKPRGSGRDDDAWWRGEKQIPPLRCGMTTRKTKARATASAIANFEEIAYAFAEVARMAAGSFS
jgi:hypothetical protein